MKSKLCGTIAFTLQIYSGATKRELQQRREDDCRT
jgi:hypothetical protein